MDFALESALSPSLRFSTGSLSGFAGSSKIHNHKKVSVCNVFCFLYLYFGQNQYQRFDNGSLDSLNTILQAPLI